VVQMVAVHHQIVSRTRIIVFSNRLLYQK